MHPAGRARPLLALAAGAVALATVWMLHPTGEPPLYDGIPITTNYRYVSPPANYDNQPPQLAHRTLSVSGARSPAINVTTPDSQARLQVDAGALDLPAGAGSVVVDIVPLAPPRSNPPVGQVDGNLYAFSVTSSGTALALLPGRAATVSLAATGNFGDEVIDEFRAPSAYTELRTQDLGQFTFTATAGQLGAFAVIGRGSSSEGVPSIAAVLVAAALAVGLIVIGVLTMRRREPRPRGGTLHKSGDADPGGR